MKISVDYDFDNGVDGWLKFSYDGAAGTVIGWFKIDRNVGETDEEFAARLREELEKHFAKFSKDFIEKALLGT